MDHALATQMVATFVNVRGLIEENWTPNNTGNCVLVSIGKATADHGRFSTFGQALLERFRTDHGLERFGIADWNDRQTKGGVLAAIDETIARLRGEATNGELSNHASV